MNILIKKLSDNIKQYGVVVVLKQIIFRCISKVYFVSAQYVFLLNDEHEAEKLDENIDIIDGKDSHEYLTFLGRSLNPDEVVFIYREGNTIKGYAFIQSAGRYKFSKNVKMTLCNDMYMLKNLFVYSEFRGERIGLKLNLARVAYAKQRPNVFVLVLKENRTAIRNIEKVGFEKVALFKLKILFNFIRTAKVMSVGQHTKLAERLKLLMES
jgi:ribosomal protein S18 acetylase RimI-like enzyme